jgi:hypothetical protein
MITKLTLKINNANVISKNNIMRSIEENVLILSKKKKEHIPDIKEKTNKGMKLLFK